MIHSLVLVIIMSVMK
ncbi:hypothetical protein EC1_09370 [Faecalitalea cylindroides T2-87]|uniref:Uncharacterized protein n=1 Tax=Faecalitalea cylindroides T2-87 TaxID=717960 RepID=D4JE69_9FIRM|nr:hypothetical protein EC1_09370 [Faecalitalea cylindroides T2-87]